MNQSFTRQQLFKLCRKSEFVDFGMTGPLLTKSLDDIFDKIVKDEFVFNISRVNDYYLTNDLPQKLVLRKLNDNLKRLYKDEQANRRIIIAQVKTLLEETCPFWVVKADIKSFYESIDRNRIIEKFQDDSMLSYHSLHLLKKVFNNHVLSETNGVPRGMNISSTLSEIYMRKFDKWILRFNGVYYYARFVDDIVIFTNTLQSALDLIKNFNSKLEELAKGLTINEKKTELFNGTTLKPLNKLNGSIAQPSKSLDYLGYSFTKEKKGKLFDLRVSIADKKIRKIKTRIVFVFLDFVKNKDFTLLENRIKFLTGNYSIRSNAEGNDLKAGIHYNYLQITDHSVFNELNIFYRKVLFSKNKKFGIKMTSALTSVQKEKLNKYCFKTGFDLKVYNSFTSEEMSDIISCW